MKHADKVVGKLIANPIIAIRKVAFLKIVIRDGATSPYIVAAFSIAIINLYD